MMPREFSRSARIEARIAPDALVMVKRAAELQGRSVSAFVVAAAQEAARRLIEEIHNIRLSVEDQQRFVDLLLNPPAAAVACNEAGQGRPCPVDPGIALMAASFLIERHGSSHNFESFSCGVEALDRYFRTHATQDVRRHAAACYVAIEAARAKVAGFYSLAAAGVPLAEMPAELAKRLPRYPSVPVARL
jgi:uncharacterized protein (DUF1778 family)